MTLLSATKSEWIKFRSIRSTIMGYFITFLVTLGIGALITISLRSRFASVGLGAKLAFDPVSTSLGGVLFAQFAVGVLGVLFITSEYSSGSIRTTLAAVPQRARLIASKVLVLSLATFLVGEVVSFVTFLMGQAIYSGALPTASLRTGSVLRSVILAGVYLTLLAILGFSLGLIVRQSGASISIFTSLLLIVPIVTFFLPQSWQATITKFEPSELGHAMMSPTPPFQLFGAGVATATLIAYVIIALVIGVILTIRRDA